MKLFRIQCMKSKSKYISIQSKIRDYFFGWRIALLIIVTSPILPHDFMYLLFSPALPTLNEDDHFRLRIFTSGSSMCAIKFYYPGIDKRLSIYELHIFFYPRGEIS